VVGCRISGAIGALFLAAAPGIWALPVSTDITPELHGILTGKIAEVRNLVQQEPILPAVVAANIANSTMTPEDIATKDVAWQQAGIITEHMRALMGNECAQALMAFQDQHDEYAEIFVTDRHGLIVCSTNRTSDYYQADEAWWVEAYADGAGTNYYGKPEYDESAFLYGIPIYVAITDPAGQSVIGIVKAVCDITAIMLGQ